MDDKYLERDTEGDQGDAENSVSGRIIFGAQDKSQLAGVGRQEGKVHHALNHHLLHGEHLVGSCKLRRVQMRLDGSAGVAPLNIRLLTKHPSMNAWGRKLFAYRAGVTCWFAFRYLN